MQSKHKGVEIKTHEASVQLNEILDKQDALRKEFMKDVDGQLARHPSPKAKTQARRSSTRSTSTSPIRRRA